MIHTARQLKALIRNQSGGDSSRANTLMRNYVMERFLERVSLLEYKDKLILKGGIGSVSSVLALVIAGKCLIGGAYSFVDMVQSVVLTVGAVTVIAAVRIDRLGTTVRVSPFFAMQNRFFKSHE